MTSKFIIEANELNYEYEVLKFSFNIPVVVYYWASWSRSCKTLDPLFDQLTHEANGSFRLARVDCDNSPNLVLQYGIRTIPTVKAISQGNVVSEFVDLIPENRLREFINRIEWPSPINIAVQKATALMNVHQWSEAEAIFRQILETNPDLSPALYGLVKCILAQGYGSQALRILLDFPPSRYYAQAEILLPYAENLAAYQENSLPNEMELDATFIHSIRLASRGNLSAAIDGMLDILRTDRNYREQKARLCVLSLLELLGEEDPQTRQYRSELATILF